ncbi:universal stress protein [Baekduia soli]|uniref:universal stress protein n=1 Tax=Baekduia soli TaxID=496014 RepID=UPI00165295C9|nr:universal stress protein [Baekduia soli]
MSSPDVVAAYDATAGAADGLALAHLLAERIGAELVVARVLTGGHYVVADRATERGIRKAVARTREAILAVIPEATDVEIVPIIDASVARGLHELARAEGASALVVGCSAHHGLGHRLLGGRPELLADGSPCPVFIAPAGFATSGGPRRGPITVAYDGTPAAEHALIYACDLAEQLRMPLRLVAVQASWLTHAIGTPRATDAVLARGLDLVRERSAGRVHATTALRHGDPAHALARETREAGLLVLGSHHRGPLGRALLGSVSAAVVRTAHGPVVVTPRG